MSFIEIFESNTGRVMTLKVDCIVFFKPIVESRLIKEDMSVRVGESIIQERWQELETGTSIRLSDGSVIETSTLYSEIQREVC